MRLRELHGPSGERGEGPGRVEFGPPLHPLHDGRRRVGGRDGDTCRRRCVVHRISAGDGSSPGARRRRHGWPRRRGRSTRGRGTASMAARIWKLDGGCFRHVDRRRPHGAGTGASDQGSSPTLGCSSTRCKRGGPSRCARRSVGRLTTRRSGHQQTSMGMSAPAGTVMAETAAVHTRRATTGPNDASQSIRASECVSRRMPAFPATSSVTRWARRAVLSPPGQCEAHAAH